MRKRARDDPTPSSWATDRRKAEDAVADAEQVVLNARAAFDQTVLEKRAGRASEPDLDSARAALSRAEDDLKQHKADLHKLEADPTTPLPTQAEGQLNVAWADLLMAARSICKVVVIGLPGVHKTDFAGSSNVVIAIEARAVNKKGPGA